jgi:hypothetical protein
VAADQPVGGHFAVLLQPMAATHAGPAAAVGAAGLAVVVGMAFSWICSLCQCPVRSDRAQFA